MTKKEIAQVAGVSPSAVTKAFNNAKDISEETRQKIFAVAKKMGCFEQHYKCIYPKKIIAIICPEIVSERYTREVALLEDLIHQRGGETVISVNHFSNARCNELFEYHTAFQKVDGVIIIGDETNIKNPLYVPTVALTSKEKVSRIDRIGVNLAGGIHNAVSYFAENGHREIGFIGEPLTNLEMNHFVSSMKKLGLKVNPDFLITADARFEQGGFEGIERIMQLPSRPTAILCGYDEMAFGAIKCLKRYGLSVPDDMSVIGIDDLGASAKGEKSLTTLKIMLEDVCDMVITLLFRKFENKFFTARQNISIECRLMKRDSVKAI